MLKSFSAFRDKFREGEILVYENSAYSHYHGFSGFFFKDQENKIRSWDLDDSESLEVWTDYFKEIAPSTSVNEAANSDDLRSSQT